MQVLKDGIEFHSTNVEKLEYNHAGNLLYVTYKRDGSKYQYKDVKINEFISLVAAPSKQSFINLYIKPRHEATKMEDQPSYRAALHKHMVDMGMEYEAAGALEELLSDHVVQSVCVQLGLTKV